VPAFAEGELFTSYEFASKPYGPAPPARYTPASIGWGYGTLKRRLSEISYIAVDFGACTIGGWLHFIANCDFPDGTVCARGTFR
jgi:hypothetical protein